MEEDMGGRSVRLDSLAFVPFEAIPADSLDV